MNKESQQEFCSIHNQPIVLYDKKISDYKKQGLCLICVQIKLNDNNIVQVDQLDDQEKEMTNALIVEYQKNINTMDNLISLLNQFKNNLNMHIDKFIEFLLERCAYIKQQSEQFNIPNKKLNLNELEQKKLSHKELIGNIRQKLDQKLQGLINLINLEHLKIIISGMGENIQKDELNETQDEECSDTDLEIQKLIKQIKDNQQLIKENQQQVVQNKEKMLQNQQMIDKNKEQLSQNQQRIENNKCLMSQNQKEIQANKDRIKRNEEQIRKNQENISKIKQALEDIQE